MLRTIPISNLILSLSATAHLTISAVVSDRNGGTHIECWEISYPAFQYPPVGKGVRLGHVCNPTYVVLPLDRAKIYTSLLIQCEYTHRRRTGMNLPLFWALLSCLAHVTLPNDDDDLWIMEGVNNLIIAVDVVGVGHIMDYPSDKPTVAPQIPFEDGRIPPHTVLRKGACSSTLQILPSEFSVQD